MVVHNSLAKFLKEGEWSPVFHCITPRLFKMELYVIWKKRDGRKVTNQIPVKCSFKKKRFKYISSSYFCYWLFQYHLNFLYVILQNLKVLETNFLTRNLLKLEFIILKAKDKTNNLVAHFISYVFSDKFTSQIYIKSILLFQKQRKTNKPCCTLKNQRQRTVCSAT